MLDAPGYGFSVQEIIFDVSAGQASDRDRRLPAGIVLFGNRYYPQVGPLQYLDQPWASEGTPVPEEKFITFTYRMRGRNRMGRPLLQSVFWPSWFKRDMQRLWVSTRKRDRVRRLSTTTILTTRPRSRKPRTLPKPSSSARPSRFRRPSNMTRSC